MSHPRAREYTKFYNQWYTDKASPSTSQPDSPCTLSSSSQTTSPTRRRALGATPHPPHPGEVGYWHEIQHTVDSPHLKQQHKQHFLVYGSPGLEGAHNNAKNIFTQLPGRTFNTQTLATFTAHAADLRTSMSPLKSRRTGAL